MRVSRVALVPSAFHPSLGGVEELTGRLALELGWAGVTPIILTNRWPRELADFELWQGVSLHRLAFRLPMGGVKSGVSFALTQRFVLKQMIHLLRQHQTQLVHVQCVSSNAWYAARASAVLGVPLVVSLQGERTMDASGVYQRHPCFNRLLLGILSAATHITGCSEAVLRDMRLYSGMPLLRNASVVYNGVAEDCFRDGPKWFHPRKYLLAYGRMVPQKGFDSLLRAFARARLPEVDLILAGDGPEEDSLKQLSDSLGLR